MQAIPSRGGRHAVRAAHLRGRDLLAVHSAGEDGRDHGRLPALRRGRRPAHPGRRSPATHGDGDDGARPRERADADRRAVRRDARAAGRVLPRRGRLPRRGAGLRRQDPRRRDRLRRGPPRDDLRRERPAGRRGGSGRLLSHAALVVDRLFRREAGRAVASLARALRDLDLAEEAVQQAFLVALERWPTEGVPENPAAWILLTARRRALDSLRRDRRLTDASALESMPAPELPQDPLPDDRLALVFACCHPSLAAEARVALTLRPGGGLTTAEG